jgi:putative intracellular protease/amidase
MRALMCLTLAVLVLTLTSPAFARPLVAILADPSGTETTDLIAPYTILVESGAVDVEIVSPTMAPVPLMPGKGWVKPQASRASFDRAHPVGADAVIVPYMMNMTDPDRAAWLRAQARHGARIVSICAGAEALAFAGLLDGRQATSHWSSIKGLSKHYPKVGWRRDARWVTDGQITTSAGVSASIPTALELVRELAGEPVMRATAARLGLEAPTRAHAGAGFRLDGGHMATAAGNYLSFWSRENVAVPVADGFDDLALAASLDGWSRTFRSEAWAVAPLAGATSRHGLVVLPAAGDRRYARTVQPTQGEPETATLAAITGAYGWSTARFVALQVEHPAAFQ